MGEIWMQQYRVLIVDDEPMAAQYIAKVIETKCPGFQVVGITESSRKLLEWLKKEMVDVVISDVMMPGMNGIELVTILQEQYPTIFSVIVSGYSEFDYVKGAIKAEVQDYLLKPLDIQEMQQLFKKLRIKLDLAYYSRRNKLLHSLSKEREIVDISEVKRLFTSKNYYAAIIRKNGVISRFNKHSDREIYSSENEQIIIYGRDDLEMLLIYPEELIDTDFIIVADREFEKQKDEQSFMTMVLQQNAFEVAELPAIVKKLYKNLDNSIVIGFEQKIYLDNLDTVKHQSHNIAQRLQKIIYFIEKKEVKRIQKELENIIAIWEQEQMSQFWVEREIRHLFYMMNNSAILAEWDEYWLDDAFSEALTMEELGVNIGGLIQQYANQKLIIKTNDKESIFQDITEYLKKHLNENLTVQKICREIGISQPMLSRLFRTYAAMPYTNYLTNLRIEVAKSIIKEQPDSYIKDVAAYVGYDNQFYFSRIFRSLTGISPTEYAEQNSGD